MNEAGSTIPENTKACKLDCGAFATYLSSTMVSHLYGIKERKLVEAVKNSDTPRKKFPGYNNVLSMLYFIELHNLIIDNVTWDRFIVTMREITEEEKSFNRAHNYPNEKFLVGTDIVQCSEGKIVGNSYIDLHSVNTQAQIPYMTKLLHDSALSTKCFSIDEVSPI